MHVKRALKASQNSVWDVPKPFKIEAWDGPGNPNAAMKLHRAAKRQPRASKKCPRDAQEAPKRGQEPPKSEQKPVKWRPREHQTLQNPFQDGTGAQSLQEALLNRPRE